MTNSWMIVAGFLFATMAVFVAWMICVVLCLPALILTRGRSRAALGALAVTVLSAVLVFV